VDLQGEEKKKKSNACKKGEKGKKLACFLAKEENPLIWPSDRGKKRGQKRASQPLDTWEKKRRVFVLTTQSTSSCQKNGLERKKGEGGGEVTAYIVMRPEGGGTYRMTPLKGTG